MGSTSLNVHVVRKGGGWLVCERDRECVSVCVCVRARERERERERER